MSAATALPPGGLLIVQVVPGGNAAQARLHNGDVLVAYAGKELTSAEQLGKVMEGQGNAKSAVVTVWRAGPAATVRPSAMSSACVVVVGSSSR